MENVILLLFIAAIIAVAIIGFATSDGKGCSPGEHCQDCPMPCDHEAERRDKATAAERAQKKYERLMRKAERKKRGIKP